MSGTYYVADDNGDFQAARVPTLPTSTGMEATFKYGMSESSDLEVVLPWVYRDKDWSLLEGREKESYAGFDRLSLSAKIGILKFPCGLIAGFDFPVGHAKVVGFDPDWGFFGGIWGGYRKGAYWADGVATWGVTPENAKGFKPGDRQAVGVNAGWQLEGGVAPQLGFSYDRTGSMQQDGKSKGSDHASLQALPGAVLELDEDWRLDVKVPTVLAGRNSFVSTGLSVHVIGNFEP
ncbi:MAG: hypothetical protein IPK50_16885 [Fibrobacterota bacterium]|nr:hypothetical protein [Fibrobacterota bacterium]QQS03957.1 MAG: hypothetical protein IPK50_16885 [Fibrobacterota bacterium]